MKTLKELIIETKCRRGKSAGTTKRGAYWEASESIMIRNYGGDGIGNNSTDWKNFLELRHYRSGEVQAVVNYHGWHQNRGTTDRYRSVPILDCATVEDVIVVLKGVNCEDEAAYSDSFEDRLTAGLAALGMAECEPAPDEIAA